jgi:hypothetical protein
MWCASLQQRGGSLSIYRSAQHTAKNYGFAKRAALIFKAMQKYLSPFILLHGFLFYK